MTSGNIPLSILGDPSPPISGGVTFLAPGSSNAPVFNGSGVVEFIEFYEMISLKNPPQQKTLLFPYYCVKDITNSLIKTQAYSNRDWLEFKSMLITRFKQDSVEESLDDLFKSINSKFTVDSFEEFVYSFDYVCSKLLSDGSALPNTKSKLFIKSVPATILDRIGSVIYTDQGILNEFGFLSDVVRKEVVYLKRMNKLRKEVERSDSSDLPPSINSETAEKLYFPNTETKNPSSSVIDKNNTESRNYKSLVEQMDDMSLAIKRIEEVNERRSNIIPQTGSQIQWARSKCAYCDGDHAKRDCADLSKDLKSGLVKIGEKGMITNSRGEVYPLNFNNGGIKTLVRPIQSAHNRHVYIEKDTGCDFCYSTNQIVKAAEFDNLVNSYAATRGKSNKKERFSPYAERSETEDVGINSGKFPLESSESLPVPRENLEIESENSTNYNMKQFEKQYKVKANIVDTNLQESVLDKCKSSKIELSLQEIASISPQIRKAINENFKPRRVVITDRISAGSPEDEITKDIGWKTEYLAVGSGKSLGKLQGAEVTLLFDEGSEINVMSSDVYNALKSLGRVKLDNSINWNLVDANQGSTKMMGVCEDMEEEIGGATVKVPIFFSNHTNTPVILGRPWDIRSRVLKDNRLDRSLWYTIRNENTDAAASFFVNDGQDARRLKRFPNSDRLSERDVGASLVRIQIRQGQDISSPENP
ncbi:hypothetical protein AYI70_g4285 [Smittium culicis]|uniref:Uncharacterized protein n=1 Tax=Smittium culicis TaxID=133412 RepID=A0A1R1XZT7_9FUNG|nr:hypothetical protein AYI70_g4285 [Smittium culicis]